MDELKDKELFSVIRRTIKANLPDKYHLLIESEKNWGDQATIADYQIWVDLNIPLDSMEAAAVYSVLYGKSITEVANLIKSNSNIK